MKVIDGKLKLALDSLVQRVRSRDFSAVVFFDEKLDFDEVIKYLSNKLGRCKSNTFSLKGDKRIRVVGEFRHRLFAGYSGDSHCFFYDEVPREVYLLTTGISCMRKYKRYEYYIGGNNDF